LQPRDPSPRARNWQTGHRTAIKPTTKGSITHDALITFYRDRRCSHGIGFGAILSAHDSSPDPKATQWVINFYPADIRGWILAKGGIEKMPIKDYWTLPASELWKMGYRKCSD
jgi:hypothetical protein